MTENQTEKLLIKVNSDNRYDELLNDPFFIRWIQKMVLNNPIITDKDTENIYDQLQSRETSELSREDVNDLVNLLITSYSILYLDLVKQLDLVMNDAMIDKLIKLVNEDNDIDKLTVWNALDNEVYETLLGRLNHIPNRNYADAMREGYLVFTHLFVTKKIYNIKKIVKKSLACSI